MKNIFGCFLLTLVSAILLHGCCGAIPSNGTNSTASKLCPTGAKNCYENYYFSVTYPDGWTVQERNSKSVSFLGPAEVDSHPTCGISVGQPNVGESFSTYINSIKIATQIDPQLTVISERNRTINGLQAYEFFFATNEGNHTIQTVYLLQIYPYTIFCDAPQTIFSKYEPQFESIITSFKTE
jgi:hypothetical protein